VVADPHPGAVAQLLPTRTAVAVFLAFAAAYFLSAVIRAITATLSPTLTQEFNLSAQHLGLLAGGYFLGFAATQLPLGYALDRYGPKRVMLVMLSVATLACLAFAVAPRFEALLLARFLCGVGLSACLMAPLTGYRRWLPAHAQLRANSWMLMTGSLGMLMSTLPVQWLLPLVGWRWMFVGLGAGVVLSIAVIAVQVPRWQDPPAGRPAAVLGYRQIATHPYFVRTAPLAFVIYGGLMAIQTLWAGPWMTQVAGYSAAQAAGGLFAINACMLVAFWAWGLLTPRLLARGFTVNGLMAWGLPFSFLALAILLIANNAPFVGAAGVLALYCVLTTFISLSQPAVAQVFASDVAGRVLSAFNLVIFAGVFCMQWGIGLVIDALRAAGASAIQAFQGAFGLYGVLSVLAWAFFVWRGRAAGDDAASHNHPP
jgi:predicted MFS family arabinose efflux permease